MNRLPTEIFQYLLTIVSEEIRSGAEPWNVYIPLAKFRLVSTRWMAAIDSHPPLWTLITNRHGQRLVFLAIERSGTLPLDIHLSYSAYEDPKQYIDTITGLAPRWLSLRIVQESYRPVHQGSLKLLLLVPTPNLEMISFNGLRVTARSVPLFDNKAPKLRTVVMIRSSPYWRSLPTSDLKRLVIQWTPVLWESNLSELAQVLIAHPSLEELELVGWSGSGFISPQNASVLGDIPMDQLRKLRLRDFPWQWGVSLVDAIRIPQSCISDISLNVSGLGTQVQVDEILKLLTREVPQAASLAVKLHNEMFERIVGFAYITTSASRIEIKFVESTHHQASENETSLARRAMDAVTEATRDADVPITLYVTCESPEPYYNNNLRMETFLSTLTIAQPLLPSVTRVKLDADSLLPFLEHATPSRFTSLSDLEISNAEDDHLLPGMAKWILERAALVESDPNATTLKTVALPGNKFHQEARNSLSSILGGAVDLKWA